VLGAWFPGVLSSPRVAVPDGEWLAGTDRVGLKRVLCLRDRRELSARALDRLDKSRAAAKEVISWLRWMARLDSRTPPAERPRQGTP
jgi:hypothetical protein